MASCVALSEVRSSSSNTAVPLTPVFNTGEVKVLLVRVSVVSLPTEVSVESGIVQVLSAVGSVTARVNSKSSAVVPSKTIEPSKG